MPATLKTTMHTFAFDLRTQDGQDGFKALKARLKAAHGLKPFEAVAPKRSAGGDADFAQEIEDAYANQPGAVTLETEHLFANQWNSALGARLFDFRHHLATDGNGRAYGTGRGYYLEQTKEMVAIRRDTLKSCWCGHCCAAPKGSGAVPLGGRFALCCIGSRYLKQADLYLLRFLPVADDDASPAPLTPEEVAELLPLYEEAQRGQKAAARVKYAETKEEGFAAAIADKEMEREGFRAMLQAGLSVTEMENAIYYTHTKRWCFGWRTPLTNEEAAAIQGRLATPEAAPLHATAVGIDYKLS